MTTRHKEGPVQKITPFLWFDKEAEEAAEFYTSIFSNSKILNVSHYGPEAPGEPGAVMTVSFELEGQPFTALNGGPEFKFTEAISLFVDCESQEEVDDLWKRLTDGGEESQCGWLKDKYGLSWQIIPRTLMELLQHEDPERAGRAMKAMLGMRKIDIDALKKAVDNS
jgi:predicted 3-demethylubiquinone-9 3-methyltransferase (glyoxalase superfamily)